MIIGLIGYARSGKDTCARFLRDEGFTTMHFAEPLKNAAAEIFGFTHEQLYGALKEVIDPFWGFSPREALQRLGTEGGRKVFGENLWQRALMRKLHPDGNFAIADVRFPNEAQAILEAGGHLVRVIRPGVAPINAHESEIALDGWYLPEIYNGGSLDDLRANVKHYLWSIQKGKR
jgi:hypothetical protein